MSVVVDLTQLINAIENLSQVVGNSHNLFSTGLATFISTGLVSIVITLVNFRWQKKQWKRVKEWESRLLDRELRIIEKQHDYENVFQWIKEENSIYAKDIEQVSLLIRRFLPAFKQGASLNIGFGSSSDKEVSKVLEMVEKSVSAFHRGLISQKIYMNFRETLFLSLYEFVSYYENYRGQNFLAQAPEYCKLMQHLQKEYELVEEMGRDS